MKKTEEKKDEVEPQGQALAKRTYTEPIQANEIMILKKSEKKSKSTIPVFLVNRRREHK